MLRELLNTPAGTEWGGAFCSVHYPANYALTFVRDAVPSVRSRSAAADWISEACKEECLSYNAAVLQLADTYLRVWSINRGV